MSNLNHTLTPDSRLWPGITPFYPLPPTPPPLRAIRAGKRPWAGVDVDDDGVGRQERHIAQGPTVDEDEDVHRGLRLVGEGGGLTDTQPDSLLPQSSSRWHPGGGGHVFFFVFPENGCMVDMEKDCGRHHRCICCRCPIYLP